MSKHLTTPVRVLFLAMALTFAAQTAEARGNATDQPQATARVTTRTKADAETSAAEREGIPLDGILIIVGIVGVMILLAWVSSRMGDSRPTM